MPREYWWRATLCALFATLCSAIPSCTTSPLPGPIPKSSSACPSWSSPAAPLSEAHAMAVKFAPHVYFHPLETYFPDSVVRYLSNARVFDSLHNDLGPATEDTMLQHAHRKDVYISARRATPTYDWRLGAPFDSLNRSTSNVYYRLLHRPYPNNTYVYHYFLWYPYNGCSQQQIISQKDGAEQLLDYEYCNLGVHEGDWEHISVEVCGDLQTILRVQYSIHAWSEELNCVNGECPMENGTHPLVVSSLSSHANYPRESFSNVYYQITNDILASLKVLSLVDRSIKGLKRWVPTPSGDNLVVVDPEPTPLNITYYKELKQRFPSRPDFTEPSWSVFQGFWGFSFLSQIRSLDNPICLFNNQTKAAACPSSHILQLTLRLWGVVESGVVGSIGDDIMEQAAVVLGNAGSRPPALSEWWSTWQPSTPSLVFENNPGVSIVCADPTLSVDELITTPSACNNRGATSLTLMSIGLAGLAVLMLMYMSTLASRSYWANTDAESICGQPIHCVRDFARSIPKMSILAMTVACLGAYSLWDGMHDSFELLRRYLATTTWDPVEITLTYTIPLLLLLDVLAFVNGVFVTGRTFEYWCLKRNMAAYVFLRDRGWHVQIGILCTLYLATAVNMVTVVYGSLFWGVHFAFLRSCDRVEALTLPVVGICLNFETFGWDSVYCGDDITEFCNEWRAIDGRQMLFAAFLITMGQLIFISAAGVHLHRFTVFRRAKIKSQVDAYKLLERMDPDAGTFHYVGPEGLHLNALHPDMPQHPDRHQEHLQGVAPPVPLPVHQRFGRMPTSNSIKALPHVLRTGHIIEYDGWASIDSDDDDSVLSGSPVQEDSELDGDVPTGTLVALGTPRSRLKLRWKEKAADTEPNGTGMMYSSSTTVPYYVNGTAPPAGTVRRIVSPEPNSDDSALDLVAMVAGAQGKRHSVLAKKLHRHRSGRWTPPVPHHSAHAFVQFHGIEHAHELHPSYDAARMSRYSADELSNLNEMKLQDVALAYGQLD